MNEIKEIPIGIVDVKWDYDEYNELKKAFYEMLIIKSNDGYEFKNIYYFLNNEIFLNKEETSTNQIKIILFDNYDKGKIEIQICGDKLFMTKKQYSLFNEQITKLQDKYALNIDIIDNINLTKNK